MNCMRTGKYLYEMSEYVYLYYRKWFGFIYLREDYFFEFLVLLLVYKDISEVFFIYIIMLEKVSDNCFLFI